MVGIVVTARGRERSYDIPVDRPCKSGRGPVYSIGMKRHLWCENVKELSTIIIACNTLAEVVVLSHTSGPLGPEIVATQFPIDLVKVVGHEDGTADDALSGGDLHDCLD